MATERNTFVTIADGDQLNQGYFNGISPTIPPIGAVVAWLKSYTNTPATLPIGWVECNGQTLSDADSVYNGQVLPNLNASGGGTKRFLRGSTTSGTTGGADTNTHNHNFTTGGPSGGSNSRGTGGNPYDGHTHSGSTDSPSDTNILPSYYEVVWVMRIK